MIRKGLLTFWATIVLFISGVVPVFAGEWTGHLRVYDILRENGIACVPENKIIINTKKDGGAKALHIKDLDSFVKKIKLVILEDGTVLGSQEVERIFFYCLKNEFYMISYIQLKDGGLVSSPEIMAFIVR